MFYFILLLVVCIGFWDPPFATHESYSIWEYSTRYRCNLTRSILQRARWKIAIIEPRLRLEFTAHPLCWLYGTAVQCFIKKSCLLLVVYHLTLVLESRTFLVAH